ncbi:MAG: SDR family NAD(P)-dependent oxidoreductase [Alcanivorax sp.]
MKDKVIWVIGASSGIGYALAKELHDQGARLILSARREEQLESLNQELGGQHLVCPLDVGEHETLVEAVASIKARYDRLDSVLFLPAIYTPHDGQKKYIETIHKMLHVNLGGAFNVVDVVQELFEAQRSGQIILCGSVAGYRGLPSGQPYCAAKAAIISYAESLKLDLEGKGVDVKVINPGFVRTPLTDKNEFEMPMIIEPEQAARVIAKEMQSRKFEIHFPKKFTFIMKMIHLLPAPLYFALMRRVNPNK